MSLATSRSDKAIAPGGKTASAPKEIIVSGRAKICFRADGPADGGSDGIGETRLADLYQSDPLRVMFPYLEAGEPPTAAVITTSGGLVGGDQIELQITAGQNAQAAVHAQASEKIYRSAGPTARAKVQLKVEAGAGLEYLPQETILFDGARFRRNTVIDLAADAQLLAGEILVLGRRAHGETFQTGFLRESWQVRRQGRLCWADCFELDEPLARVIEHPAGLNGGHVLATLVCSTPQAAAMIDPVRELLRQCGPATRAGASLVNGTLLLRWLGGSGQEMRQSFAEVWRHLRQAVLGRPPAMPRLWHI